MLPWNQAKLVFCHVSAPLKKVYQASASSHIHIVNVHVFGYYSIPESFRERKISSSPAIFVLQKYFVELFVNTVNSLCNH